MQNEHTINGLLRKRAELAGKIEGAQTVLRQLIIDLDNIDAAIRIFKPDIDLEQIKPQPLPPRHAAFKGEVTSSIFNYLRDAPGPLTSKQMAERLMRERGLNDADKRLVVLITKRIGAALKHHRNRGALQSIKGPDGFLLWEVVR
jgi:hypothetical protein